MIVCPNCNHQNPDGAVQCEACYTPLPAMTTCPNCGAKVQADASFCGQCGFNLQVSPPPAVSPSASPVSAAVSPTMAPDFDIPDLPAPDPLVSPDPLVNIPSTPPQPTAPISVPQPRPAAPAAFPPPLSNAPASPMPAYTPAATQLQRQTARLLHIQTNTLIELPQNLPVVHIGKPNDRVPPDVDVSGFPSSEIVSRIHADLRLEGEAYYIEDMGSSNGTYINNMPLPLGNRHRLRPGDRIALGKGDRVTFVFQLA